MDWISISNNRIENPADYLFSIQTPEDILKQLTESVTRSVVGQQQMDFVLTEGRSEIVVRIEKELQRILDEHRAGIRIAGVNLQDVQPPEEVQQAFEDAIKAREDRERLVNEAQAYANEIVPKARGEAARLIAEAEAYQQTATARAEGEADRFRRILAEYRKHPDVTRRRTPHPPHPAPWPSASRRMNMKTQISIFSIAALLLFASLWLAVFAVPQNHKAIRFRLGRIVEADYTPGLHFKLPLLESAKSFDARIVSLDLPPERFLTAEKKNVIVDALALWRIDDVVRFYTSVQGDRESANLRLGQMLKDVMRGQFGRRQIRDLVAEDRARLRDLLVSEAREAAADLGIQLVDVRIKRIDLPREVSASVFRRMEAERSRVAKELRSQGAEAAERIRAGADKQRQILLAEAYRQSQRLKGIGDAWATEIYASAYAEDPDFFAFLRRHEAYRKGLVQPGDKLVLKPDAPFFRDFAKDE